MYLEALEDELEEPELLEPELLPEEPELEDVEPVLVLEGGDTGVVVVEPVEPVEPVVPVVPVLGAVEGGVTGGRARGPDAGVEDVEVGLGALAVEPGVVVVVEVVLDFTGVMPALVLVLDVVERLDGCAVDEVVVDVFAGAAVEAEVAWVPPLDDPLLHPLASARPPTPARTSAIFKVFMFVCSLILPTSSQSRWWRTSARALSRVQS